VYRASGLVAGDYIIEVPVSRTTMAAPPSDAGPGRNAFGEQFGNLLVANGWGRRGELPAVIAGDNKVATYPTAFHPSSATLSNATVISLRTSEEKTDIDVQLRLVPAFTVRGLITDPDGLPAANVAVGLVSIDEQSNVDGAADSVATSSTDARGEFTMLGVPAGTYQMMAEQIVPPVARGGGSPPELAHTGTAAWARGRVVVIDHDVTDAAMTLHPTLMVSGRVMFNGAAPRPTTQQLARAVRLEPIGPGTRTGGDAIGLIPASPISADGSFALAGYLPGAYMILPTSWPALKWIATSITAGGRDVSDMPIDIDRDLTDVVIAFSDKPAALAGSVRRTNGEAETSALVVGFPANPRAWGGAGIHKFSTRTSASGTYAAASLAPGEYLVAAIPDEIARR
jgi:hypothetical protein